MRLNRNLTFLGLFNFFESLDFFAPIRFLYFYQITQSFPQAAGLLSLVSIFSALLEVPTGIFSDLIGRKQTMILGALSITLSYILYAIGTEFWVLALGTIFHGAGRAFFSGNNNAYLYNLVEETGETSNYSRYYGRMSSIEVVSFFIASLLSGFLFAWSFRDLMWICVVTQFLSFLAATQLQNIKSINDQSTNVYTHLKEAFLEVKNNVRLRNLSLAKIFGGAGDAGYEVQSGVFNAVWPTWAVGIARAAQEVGSLPGYYFADKINKKIGELNSVMLLSVVSFVGNILAAAFQSIISPFLILSQLIFYGPADTASENLMQKEFTPRQRATIASLNSLGFSLYFALVTTAAGFVASYSNIFYGLLTTQVFFIPVIYYRWKLFKNRNYSGN